MTATDRAKILIVDDEREVADAYAAQLSSRYDVETAYSGEEALEARSVDVDVVLLDRRMPEVAGQDVLADIRARGLDTRVAMVTAIDPDFDIIDMPFDDYVVKPARRTDLFETVERLLTCAAYESHIREYYSLTSKYAALQASKTNAELENNEEFQELAAKLDDRRAELDRIVDSFDDDDFEVVLRDFDVPGPTPSESG
jgi:DNA-binding response OmpR family regulator